MMQSTSNQSPVAHLTPAKKRALQVGMGIAAAVTLYLIFSGSHTPAKREAPLPINDTATDELARGPHLPLSSKQITQLKNAVKEWHEVKADKTAEETQKLYRMRMVAPTTVYSAGETGSGITSDKADDIKQGNVRLLGGDDTKDANSRFLASVSRSKAPRENATLMLHPSTTITQGAILAATLETRIVSDLPGMLRAVTSEDVYSDDQSQVLIPKGSSLIGQYSSGVVAGQNRIFVVWQRLKRSDGIDIQLNSPGTDPLGGSGIGADGIDHHFFEQFGTATLLSLIGAGTASLGVKAQDEFNSASSYRAAVAQSFRESAQNTLQSTGQIKPTLYVNQGTKISIFVARDLDFTDALKKAAL